VLEIEKWHVPLEQFAFCGEEGAEKHKTKKNRASGFLIDGATQSLYTYTARLLANGCNTSGPTTPSLSLFHFPSSGSKTPTSIKYSCRAHHPINRNPFTPLLLLPFSLRSIRLVLLEDGQGVHGVLLLGLGHQLLEDGSEVAHVLLGLGPLLLGQDLLLQAELRRAADAVDAVVALARRQAGERLEDRLVLFD
jgi:hypothetical protein